VCFGHHESGTQPLSSSSSSSSKYAHHHHQQQQTRAAGMGVQLEGSGLEVPGLSHPEEMSHASEMSHAILSPGFNRAAISGSISAPDLPGLVGAGGLAAAGLGVQSYPAAAAAGAAAVGGSSSSRSNTGCCVPADGIGGGGVALPNLRQLYLKLCFVPSAALSALLGSSHAYTQAQQQQQQQRRRRRRQQPGSVGCQQCGAAGGSSSSSSSSSTVCQAGVRPLTAPCGLEVLSVTGDGLVRAEVCEVWAGWLHALGQQRGLQVRKSTSC
jgi:hypothetical protein